ncbi:MAG TPA: MFS transporter [Candidatus Paceibacterota bacterium]|nr:MFS transporter [Verrucomicrobiota bacterium]HOX02867.1 MFS transporter [Verrucomicrobiota bacterium]HRZ45619.1 MFS transporter [Candidatus Paceibacterota bacterium]HRZ92533.1 MFS transporter [Candidatus Paceibacterota bacterium]
MEIDSRKDDASRVRERWLVLAAAFLGWMFDGLEMGIFPLAARPALQDLLGVQGDAEVGRWMGIITAMFLFGAASGGVVFGWLGDRLGRVRSMVVSILTYSLFTGCCYFVAAPWQLGVFRFLAALGMGGEWSLGVALVMECWPEKNRPLLAGAIGAASNVGFGLIGVLGMLFHVTTTSWRWVMLAGAAPALLALFIVRYVPESRRWKDSVQSAAGHPLREVFSPGLRRVTILAIAFASVALIGTWGSVQWLPLWADQLTRGEQPAAKALTQILTSVGAIGGCFLGPWIGGRMGRRPAYFLLCLGSLVSCGILYRWVGSYGSAFLVLVFVVGAMTAAFYGWLPLYLPELFPTRARATGQGLSFNFGRILAAFGAISMGELIAYFGNSYARASATITLVYVAGMVLIWLAPETRGRPLPE